MQVEQVRAASSAEASAPSPRPSGEPERRTGPRRAWQALRRGSVPEPVTAPAPPPDGPALLAVARAALTSGRYEQADELAERAVRARPLDAVAHRLRGEALVGLRRDGQALIALRKALYLDPDDALAHLQLAGALSRTGARAAAAREYRTAAEVAGRRPAGAPAPELDGRSGEQLEQLCRRLADELSGWPAPAGVDLQQLARATGQT